MPKKEVSFRNTTRDLKLYNRILEEEKYEQSDFVKDAIEYYINYLNSLKQTLNNSQSIENK